MTSPAREPGDPAASRRLHIDDRGRTPARWRWRRGRIPLDQPSWAQRRSVVSRCLHWLGDASAHAAAGSAATALVIGWVLVGLGTGFQDWWETVLYSVASSVTLIMVFAIQHTQSRQQLATQRKLDELVRAMPSADNRLIAAEAAPDHELEALSELNATDRERAMRDSQT